MLLPPTITFSTHSPIHAQFALSTTESIVSVTTVDDVDFEGDHQFIVQITATNFGAIDTSDTVTVTIKDNGKVWPVV